MVVYVGLIDSPMGSEVFGVYGDYDVAIAEMSEALVSTLSQHQIEDSGIVEEFQEEGVVAFDDGDSDFSFSVVERIMH